MFSPLSQSPPHFIPNRCPYSLLQDDSRYRARKPHCPGRHILAGRGLLREHVGHDTSSCTGGTKKHSCLVNSYPNPASFTSSLPISNPIAVNFIAKQDIRFDITPGGQQIHIAFDLPNDVKAMRHPCFKLESPEALAKLQRRVWEHFEMGAESEGAPLEADRPGEPDSGTLILLVLL